MIDTILLDFFGTLVKYSASRAIQDFSMTHECVRKNIASLEYRSFVETWDKAFSYLEQQSRVSQLEFSMKDVVLEFSIRVGNQDLTENAITELIDLYMDE